MRYLLNIIADHDMTEDEALNVIDVLKGTHDSASVGARRIEVDGAGLGRGDLFSILRRLNSQGYVADCEVF